MRPPRTIPDTAARRPPEPVRPLPARRSGVGLLAAMARRKRYRRPMLP